jgi:phage terminase large subunit-like protein
VFGPPSLWVPAVVRAAKIHDASVVAESNQGGALVREAIHTKDPTIRVRLVTAKVSKMLRADPVAMAAQQNRMRMFRRLPELEDQMTTWDPAESGDSPDRVDALVHAFAGVITAPVKRGKSMGGVATVSNPGRARIRIRSDRYLR